MEDVRKIVLPLHEDAELADEVRKFKSKTGIKSGVQATKQAFKIANAAYDKLIATAPSNAITTTHTR